MTTKCEAPVTLNTKCEAPVTLNTKLYEAERLLKQLNNESGIMGFKFEFTLFDPSETTVDKTIDTIKKFMKVLNIKPSCAP